MTKSIGKFLFLFLLFVTNLKLKYKKFYFELLIRKIKKQNLDLEVTPNFFIEMKYYTIHLIEMKFRIVVIKCRHIGFRGFRYKSCPQ